MSSHYSPLWCCCVLCHSEHRTSSLSQHLHFSHQHLFPLKPRLFGNCLHCHKEVRGYDEKKLCNSSCAAKYNNAHRSPDVKRGPAPKDPTLTKAQRQSKWQLSKSWRSNIEGAYSPLYHSKCATCKKLTITRTQQKFCEEHSDQYSHNQRGKFWFSFALSDYPTLFNFELLKQHGMRSKKNPSGVVRDHRVSVADAIKYNYDAYYIKHPLNCELMLSADNSKKYTNSSITYDELVKVVDEWDALNMVPSVCNPYETQVDEIV